MDVGHAANFCTRIPLPTLTHPLVLCVRTPPRHIRWANSPVVIKSLRGHIRYQGKKSVVQRWPPWRERRLRPTTNLMMRAIALITQLHPKAPIIVGASILSLAIEVGGGQDGCIDSSSCGYRRYARSWQR